MARTAVSNDAKSTPQKTRWGRLLLFALAMYAGVCLVMMFLETKLLYFPLRQSDSWEPAQDLTVQDIWLTSADGTKLHAWWYPQPRAERALLFCHGNGGNLSHRQESIAELRDALDVSVLIFDYPGYGRSEGEPSEAGCYAAGDAACDWLAQQVPAEKIIFFGESLGGGIATDLAVRRPHAALVLDKTFTSIPDMAQQMYPFLPARWLVRHRYDNLEKIARCTGPVFIGHGDSDTLIPYAHGERLYAAAREPKRFFLMKGIDHNDGITPECLASLAEFLKQNAPAVAAGK